MNEVFQYKLQVLESHLDTFGHVNNAVYLELYEEARWDFITKNNFGLDKIMSDKQGPVVLEVNVKFKRELKLREWVQIESQSLSITNAKLLNLTQKMIKEDGKIASEATFTMGFMDLKERKLITPPQTWLEAIGIK